MPSLPPLPSGPPSGPPLGPPGAPPPPPLAKQPVDVPADRGEVGELLTAAQREVTKVVVGQDAVVAKVMGAILVGGHVLLEGVPGVAKTLLAQTLARTLGLDFRRVQFTPDMLPSDLTGTVVLRHQELTFNPGPVFTQVLLGDEINRTPPKTQAALLEAMQEQQVTVDGTSHGLPEPFLVLATQNPLDERGTYPLPEAQLDRFHVRVLVGYPDAQEELAILRLEHDGVRTSSLDAVQVVTDAQRLRGLRRLVAATHVEEAVLAYVVNVVRATREAPGVQIGASPRAAVHVLAAAKANARLSGRAFATPDDVVAVLPTVLEHRIVLRPEAEVERIDAAAAIRSALARVPVPR